jgi:hypothetical protein
VFIVDTTASAQTCLVEMCSTGGDVEGGKKQEINPPRHWSESACDPSPGVHDDNAVSMAWIGHRDPGVFS